MAELIVALDVETYDKALSLASSLRGLIRWFKVGLELFTAQGPSIVRELKSLNCKVFLDLKFYDIPNTVAGAVRSAASLNVDMLTIHCQGGQRMCHAALKAAHDSPVKPLIFGVSVLTSFADGELPGLDISASSYALTLADLASQWALPGLVCSGEELGEIKSRHPDLLCLCPGIRPKNMNPGDQKRVITPATAVKRGADFLVVGRPIIQSPNPPLAAREILEEMQEASRELDVR